MIVKYSVRFSLHKPSGDRKSVRVRIHFGGVHIDINSGILVDPMHWDKTSMRVDKKHKNYVSINRVFSTIESNLSELFEITAATANDFPAKREIQECVWKSIGAFNKLKSHNKDTNDISYHIDMFVSEQRTLKSWSESTTNKFTTLKNHLHGFRPHIVLNDLCNESFYTGFSNYIISLGYKNSTIIKCMKLLYWFARWVDRNGLVQQRITFPDIKFKGTDSSFKKIIYLEPDELFRLYNFRYEDSYLERVKDVFCFCCFTGLRWSDVYALSKNDIHSNQLEIVTRKTNERIIVELNRYAQTILDKYSSYKSDKALPVISNQKMNIYLKEVFRIAELDRIQDASYYNGSRFVSCQKPLYEVITTHAARRTFVVTAMYLGIEPAVIMKWTGHSDYKSMKPYIAIIDSLRQKEMLKFDSVFENGTKKVPTFTDENIKENKAQ